MALVVKNPPVSAGNVRDVGSVPGSGGSHGGGHGNSLQYSCLDNPVDRRVLWVIVHKATESDMTEATEQMFTHNRLIVL